MFSTTKNSVDWPANLPAHLATEGCITSDDYLITIAGTSCRSRVNTQPEGTQTIVFKEILSKIRAETTSSSVRPSTDAFAADGTSWIRCLGGHRRYVRVTKRNAETRGILTNLWFFDHLDTAWKNFISTTIDVQRMSKMGCPASERLVRSMAQSLRPVRWW